MSGDPLDKYRRKPAPPTGEAPPPRSADGYIAFDAKDSVDRLRIRRSDDMTRSPRYNLLLDVVYDGNYGTRFILVYTFLWVMVKGRNLQPVVTALEMNVADFIQEYDASRWPMPTDEKAPFIESIEVVEGETGSTPPDNQNGGNEKQKGLNLH